jgi:hypothetical protein
MLTWFRQLDELLRGDRTSPDALREGRFNLPVRVFLTWAIVLGLLHGSFIGWFALFSDNPHGDTHRYLQLTASTLKLPLLFLLTLGVTFPSLYVFGTLMGSRLDPRQTLRLLLASIVINLAVAASLGPILAFFTLCTSSYHFMILLNVGILGVAGLIGLGFLMRTLARLVEESVPLAPPEPPSAFRKPPGVQDAADVEPIPAARPAEPISPSALAAASIVRVWMVLYAIVGMQMGWVLRPFIGNPEDPFTWFRERQGNVFASILGALRGLFGL